MTKTLEQRLAEGPGSRELSDGFLLAMGWRYEVKEYGNLVYRKRWIWPTGEFFHQQRDPQAEPDPTRSVDDVLAMVPEGWSVLDLGEGVGEREGWFWCTLHKRGVIETNDDVDGEARGGEDAYNENIQDCLARAICLAILKC